QMFALYPDCSAFALFANLTLPLSEPLARFAAPFIHKEGMLKLLRCERKPIVQYPLNRNPKSPLGKSVSIQANRCMRFFSQVKRRVRASEVRSECLEKQTAECRRWPRGRLPAHF